MIWAPTALLTVVIAIAGCGGGDSDEVLTPVATADDTTTLYFTSGEQFRKVRRELPGAGSEIERAAPAGTFAVFREEEMSWSVPFSQWLPWASYFFQGIAFHEYADVPTYPASHGCVRVPQPEARSLYRFAAIGRKVVVY